MNVNKKSGPAKRSEIALGYQLKSWIMHLMWYIFKRSNDLILQSKMLIIIKAAYLAKTNTICPPFLRELVLSTIVIRPFHHADRAVSVNLGAWIKTLREGQGESHSPNNTNHYFGGGRGKSGSQRVDNGHVSVMVNKSHFIKQICTQAIPKTAGFHSL